MHQPFFVITDRIIKIDLICSVIEFSLKIIRIPFFERSEIYGVQLLFSLYYLGRHMLCYSHVSTLYKNKNVSNKNATVGFTLVS